MSDIDNSSFYVSTTLNKTIGTNVKDFFVMKCSKATGDTVWTKEYDKGDNDYSQGMITTPDKGALVFGTSNNPVSSVSAGYAMKIDSIGNVEWDYLSTNSIYNFNNAVEIADGYLLNSQGFAGIIVTKLDLNGNFVWNRTILSAFQWEVQDMVVLNNTNLYITGRSANTTLGFLLKTDTALTDDLTWINTQMYYDQNSNCMLDSGEIYNVNGVLEFNGGQPFLVYAGANGSSNILLDTGTYNISHSLPETIWDSVFCEYPNGQVTVSSTDDTLYFGLSPSSLCPYLEVDIAALFIRLCDTNTVFNINYSNNGASIEDSAWVTVTLDSNLTLMSSSIPWTDVTGNTYTFPIG